eukprot:CAMPEP_0113880316 /NCGR_PEP_ID=MMETSP0780_2-20120614/7717_1 /TAXON_ID=652834 /ORGANISM="Palpitomonas bilix" /LENGTH=148 /DNA_ID=CAMNT_0000866977 /DNA_START=64 /DNA_END=510 /DNA_ORIENTATION=+ /assembly_acc=CAM_ASM_000599
MLRSAFSTFSTTVVRPTSLVFRAYATKTYYSKTHEYIQVDGDVGTVGISDFAQESVGEVVFVDVNAVGTAVNKGEPFGAIESVKAASDVYAPVSGEITNVNAAVSESPDIINSDAEGNGWLMKMKISDPSELDSLMDKEAFDKFCAEE